jgi:hypothetical protein
MDYTLLRLYGLNTATVRSAFVLIRLDGLYTDAVRWNIYVNVTVLNGEPASVNVTVLYGESAYINVTVLCLNQHTSMLQCFVKTSIRQCYSTSSKPVYVNVAVLSG